MNNGTRIYGTYFDKPLGLVLTGQLFGKITRGGRVTFRPTRDSVGNRIVPFGLFTDIVVVDDAGLLKVIK